MSRDPALWRKTFDAVERPIGRWLQSGVHRDDFSEVVILGTRLQRGVGRRVEGVTTALLHVANIPARRDVRRLAAQLTRIERELRAMSEAVERQAKDEQVGK